MSEKPMDGPDREFAEWLETFDTGAMLALLRAQLTIALRDPTKIDKQMRMVVLLAKAAFGAGAVAGLELLETEMRAQHAEPN